MSAAHNSNHHTLGTTRVPISGVQPADQFDAGLQRLDGARFVWAGGNCSTLLIPAQHYVFSLAGEDLHSIPSSYDGIIHVCVYPRFGRSDPERIFADSAFPVPDFSIVMPATIGDITDRLVGYRMSDVEALSVIRLLGAWQSSEQQREWAIPDEAVRFTHAGTVIIDPCSDESGMQEVDPLAYYGADFQASPFWSWRIG